jgi:hypothetical protein
MRTHAPVAALAAILIVFTVSANAAERHDSDHGVRQSERLRHHVPSGAYDSMDQGVGIHAPTRYDLYDFQLHGRG